MKNLEPHKEVGTSKIAEMLYRLSLRADFQEDIKSHRRRFGIPENGSDDIDTKTKWVNKINNFAFSSDPGAMEFLENYYGGLIKIMTQKKYALPATPETQTLLELYILENKIFPTDPMADSLGSQESPFFMISGPETGESDRANVPFVKLWIFDGASVDATTDYTKNNWNFIKLMIENQGGSPNKRVRVLKNKERDEKIFELSKEPMDKLREMSGHSNKISGGYKDLFISRIMREKYKILVTPDNVRKIISKQKKLRRL